MSLAELIVYMALSVIVLTMVGTIFGRALSTQQDVKARSNASAAGQTFMDSFRRTGQNALAMDFSASGNVLVAQVRKITDDTAPDDTDPANFQCIAWVHDPVTRAVSTVADPGAFPIDADSEIPPGTVVLRDVVAGTGGAFTTREGTSGVNVNISIVSDNLEPLASLSTTVVMRPQGEPEGAPTCF